jgi:hypothetical protein
MTSLRQGYDLAGEIRMTKEQDFTEGNEGNEGDGSKIFLPANHANERE